MTTQDDNITPNAGPRLRANGILIRFACAFLALFVPFLNFLIFNDYVETRSEILLVVSVFFAAALFVSLLFLFQKVYLEAVLYGAILVVFCDFAFSDLVKQETLLASLAVLGAIFVAAVLIRVFLAKACWQALLAFLVVFLVTDILAPQSGGVSSAGSVDESDLSAAAQPGLPPVIHIVLDEHIGLDGFPADQPGSAEARSEIMDFYQRWGFRLYSRAFSEEFSTSYSLQSLFAVESRQVVQQARGVASANTKTEGAGILQPWEARGYRFKARGITDINVCDYLRVENLDCGSYDALSIRILKNLSFPITQKALLIVGNYLKQSTLYTTVLNIEVIASDAAKAVHIDLPVFEVEAYSLSTFSSYQYIGNMIDDIPAISDGDYRLYHLIIPHFPYVFAENCSVRDVRTWQKNDNFRVGDFNTTESREEKYGMYFLQTHCLYRKLEVFMQALQAAGLDERAILVFHGDHGSRIAMHLPANATREEITHSDLVDNYSTLFAVRAPAFGTGVDTARVSMQDLFASFVANGFKDLPPSEVLERRPMVNLHGQPEDRWIEMPDFGNEWH